MLKNPNVSINKNNYPPEKQHNSKKMISGVIYQI